MERAPMDPAATLWYDRPAENWEREALPIGNGRLGAMIFGGVNEERFAISEESVWSGSKGDNNRENAAHNLPEIRKLLREGKNVEAEELVNQTFICKGAGSGHGSGANVPFGCFQELGNIRIRWKTDPQAPSVEDGKDVQDYRRQLDPREAITSVQFNRDGVNYQREAFSSAPDQVMVFHFTADKPGAISFSIHLDRAERFETRMDGQDGLLMSGQLNIGQPGVEGLTHVTRLRAIPRGGSTRMDGNILYVEGADEVTILVAGATNYQGFAGRATEDPLAATAKDVEKASSKPYRELRRDHVVEYKGFYDRMALELSDGTEESAKASVMPTDQRMALLGKGGRDPALAALYFNYGRYPILKGSAEFY